MDKTPIINDAPSTMSEVEQLAWLVDNRATVWFGSKGWLGDSKGVPGVKVKVNDAWCSGAIYGRTLQEAINHIEKRRRENQAVREAYQSLKRIRQD